MKIQNIYRKHFLTVFLWECQQKAKNLKYQIFQIDVKINSWST